MHYKKIRYLTTRNVAQYPLHHWTYLATKFEVATSNGLGGIHLQENTLFDLDPKVKVTRNVAQYPLISVPNIDTLGQNVK